MGGKQGKGGSIHPAGTSTLLQFAYSVLSNRLSKTQKNPGFAFFLPRSSYVCSARTFLKAQRMGNLLPHPIPASLIPRRSSPFFLGRFFFMCPWEGWLCSLHHLEGALWRAGSRRERRAAWCRSCRGARCRRCPSWRGCGTSAGRCGSGTAVVHGERRGAGARALAFGLTVLSHPSGGREGAEVHAIRLY